MLMVLSFRTGWELLIGGRQVIGDGVDGGRHLSFLDSESTEEEEEEEREGRRRRKRRKRRRRRIRGRRKRRRGRRRRRRRKFGRLPERMFIGRDDFGQH
jgi:hypothetical protein